NRPANFAGFQTAARLRYKDQRRNEDDWVARVGRETEDSETSGGAFTHPDPVVDEALEWFARQQNAALDPAARRQFEAWLARSPRHAEEFRNLQAMWGSAGLRKAAEAMPVASRSSVEGRDRLLSARAQHSRWPLRVSAAAVVVLAIG